MAENILPSDLRAKFKQSVHKTPGLKIKAIHGLKLIMFCHGKIIFLFRLDFSDVTHCFVCVQICIEKCKYLYFEGNCFTHLERKCYSKTGEN